MSDTPRGEQQYPGQRLQLPEDGSGSIASWGRRLAALFIDWFASLAIASVLVGTFDLPRGLQPAATSAVFLLEVTVGVAFFNASFGQLAARVVVVRLDGAPMDILRALTRTVLIMLVIPPVVFNRDYRGLHDLAVNTVALRR